MKMITLLLYEGVKTNLQLVIYFTLNIFREPFFNYVFLFNLSTAALAVISSVCTFSFPQCRPKLAFYCLSGSFILCFPYKVYMHAKL